MLSILTTIFKAALLFPVAEGIGELKWIRFTSAHSIANIQTWDAASRSPWGSLKLLRTNLRDILTSLGAVIIVLSIAMDPFAQQVLEFYTCKQSAAGLTASIPRTYNYTMESWLDAPVVSGLYQGLLVPPSSASAAISVTCPFGNCTFGEPDSGLTYSSLAVCSSVADISSSLNGSADWDTWSGWNFSLPTRLHLEKCTPNLNATFVMTTQYQLYSGNHQARSQLIMLNLDCGKDSVPIHPNKDFCAAGIVAFNITFVPCIHIYGNPTYVNFVFHEDLLSTTLVPMDMTLPTHSLAGNYPSTPDVDCSESASPQGRKTIPTNFDPQNKHRYLVRPKYRFNDTHPLNIT